MGGKDVCFKNKELLNRELFLVLAYCQGHTHTHSLHRSVLSLPPPVLPHSRKTLNILLIIVSIFACKTDSLGVHSTLHNMRRPDGANIVIVQVDNPSLMLGFSVQWCFDACEQMPKHLK